MISTRSKREKKVGELLPAWWYSVINAVTAIITWNMGKKMWIKLLYKMKKRPLTVLLSDIPNKLGKATEANRIVQAVGKTVIGKAGGVLLIQDATNNEPINIMTNMMKIVILLFTHNPMYKSCKSV